MAMKLIKKTAEYKIFMRGDDRYAIQDANGKPVNGEEKVRILVEEDLIKVTLPSPKEEAAESEDAADSGDEAAEVAAGKGAFGTAKNGVVAGAIAGAIEATEAAVVEAAIVGVGSAIVEGATVELAGAIGMALVETAANVAAVDEGIDAGSVAESDAKSEPWNSIGTDDAGRGIEGSDP